MPGTSASFFLTHNGLWARATSGATVCWSSLSARGCGISVFVIGVNLIASSATAVRCRSTAKSTNCENPPLAFRATRMTQPPPTPTPWRLSVAPMMDWTDRHCRFFHRLLSRHTRLYTEMVTTGALLHGSVERHLRFNAEEHPVALQLGGSEAADLAHAARLGAQWGYDEINLNCGCPSERVQRGAFGACLMNEPALVADGVKAMVDAVSLPVTVKHRVGIDKNEDYGFVRDFVGTVSEAGCPRRHALC